MNFPSAVDNGRCSTSRSNDSESHGENIDDSGNVERGECRRSDAAEFIEADVKRASKQTGSGMIPSCRTVT